MRTKNKTLTHGGPFSSQVPGRLWEWELLSSQKMKVCWECQLPELCGKPELLRNVGQRNGWCGASEGHIAELESAAQGSVLLEGFLCGCLNLGGEASNLETKFMF